MGRGRRALTSTLDLWAIGNGQVSALIDRRGTIVWGCLPRIDGDPVFCSLLNDDSETGSWPVTLEDCIATEQHYLADTAVLITRHRDGAGNVVEIADFCPWTSDGSLGGYARVLTPIAGVPKVRSRLAPMRDWGAAPQPVREETLALHEPVHLAFGNADPATLDDTIVRWRDWVAGLSVPARWREPAVRAAIGLKLCRHDASGALTAALTTSLPEHADSGRNWDYRYCWIRDGFYSAAAFAAIGARGEVAAFNRFLVERLTAAAGQPLQPLFGIEGETALPERIEPNLAGYRGMGPVRIGNQAASQIQHDAYGQIILSALLDPAAIDEAGLALLEQAGEHAWALHDRPDAGLWELRTRASVHTYSAAMCWAACDRLARLKPEPWRDRAEAIRSTIESRAWRPATRRYSATFENDVLDASLLQLAAIGFVSYDDPGFLSTLEAIERELRRGLHMLRYRMADDFGEPVTAFNFCTFWLIEALARTGRRAEAEALFEEILAHCTAAGLLSEDIDSRTGELWGNYPQAYSLAGIIGCAVTLSAQEESR